jgi:thioredoxin 1
MDELEKKKLAGLEERYSGRDIQESMPDAPLNVSDVDVDRVVKKYPVVIVDCWAAWCGPCRTVEPVVEELAKEMRGRVVFGKLNVDENPLTSVKYKVMSIPTLLVFKNGELVDRIIGAIPKDELKQRLETFT